MNDAYEITDYGDGGMGGSAIDFTCKAYSADDSDGGREGGVGGKRDANGCAFEVHVRIGRGVG